MCGCQHHWIVLCVRNLFSSWAGTSRAQPMSPRPLISNVVPAITELGYNQHDHIQVITYHGNCSTSLHQIHLCSKETSIPYSSRELYRRW